MALVNYDPSAMASLAAMLKGQPDLDVIELAAHPHSNTNRAPMRVRTAAGVRKYQQPIGTIITPQMQAAAKARASGSATPSAPSTPSTPAAPKPSVSAPSASGSGRRTATDADLKLGAKLHIGSGSTLYRVVHHDPANNKVIVSRDSTPGTPPVSKGTWYPASKFQVPHGAPAAPAAPSSTSTAAPAARPGSVASAIQTGAVNPNLVGGAIKAPAASTPAPTVTGAPAWYLKAIQGNGRPNVHSSAGYKTTLPGAAVLAGVLSTLPAGLTWDRIADDAPGAMSPTEQRAYVRMLDSAAKRAATPATPTVSAPVTMPSWAGRITQPAGLTPAQLLTWNQIVSAPFIPNEKKMSMSQQAALMPSGINASQKLDFYRLLGARNVEIDRRNGASAPTTTAPATPAAAPKVTSTVTTPLWTGRPRPDFKTQEESDAWDKILQMDVSSAASVIPSSQFSQHFPASYQSGTTPGAYAAEFLDLLRDRNDAVRLNQQASAAAAPYLSGVATPNWAPTRPTWQQNSVLLNQLWDDILTRDTSENGTPFTPQELSAGISYATIGDVRMVRDLMRAHNDEIAANKAAALQNTPAGHLVNTLRAMGTPAAPSAPAGAPAAPATTKVPKRAPGTAYNGGATARTKAKGPLPQSATMGTPGYKAVLELRVKNQLPFDLEKASRTERVAYAKANGATYTHSTPKNDMNAWIKAFLMKDVDPTGSKTLMDEVESRAQESWDESQKAKLASRGVQAFAQASANVAPTAAAQPAAVPTPPTLDPPDPVIHSNSQTLTFTKSAKQTKLAGWARKYQIEDQTGNVWIFKPEEKVRGGLSGEYRSDMEDAAHHIGNHLGFDTAESRMLTINGERGQAQRMFAGVTGDLTGVDVTTLSAREMQDLADEHLLDWVLANHDSHFENLLRLNNGTLVGIDKGQAFKYFGKDKLAVDYRPGPMQTKSNPVDDLYKGILSGSIDQATADSIVKSALERAARIELADNQPIIDALITAQKKRPKETYRDGVPNTADELAKAVVKRKERLSRDFEKFYKDLYGKAGLVWDADKLVPHRQDMASGRVEGAYSGISDSLIKDAQRSQINGVASMFAGTDIEDGNILFWQEEWDGKDVLRAQFTTRKEADGRIVQWLTQNAGHLIGMNASATPQAATQPSDLAMESDWWDALQGIAKNYAHHAGTANHSTRRIAQLQQVKAELESWHAMVKGGTAHRSRVPDLDKDNHLAMTEYYLKIANDLEASQKAATKPALVSRYTMLPPKATPATTNQGTSAPSMNIKVEKVQNGRQKGVLDTVKGILKVKSSQVDRQQGDQYKITVDDDLEIDYRPWDPSGSRYGSSGSYAALSQQGVLRVAAKNPTGKAADFEKAKKVLEEMGIDLKPAEADDLELLYWRNMLGSLQDRVEGQRYGDYRDTVRHVENNVSQGMSPQQEIAVIKAAFKLIPEMDDQDIEDAEWRPQFSHTRTQDLELETGRPYFLRPDMPIKDMRKITKGHFPTHALTSGSILDIARSGQLVSAEERIRLLGQFTSGSHASSDQQSGGANWLFGNFGIDSSQVTFGGASRWSSTKKPMLLMNPDVLRRTSTYHFPQMGGGAISSRASSARWNPKKWTASSSNAIHIKNAISFMDDVEVVGFDSDTERDEYLKFLREHKITEIRGVPIEDRFVNRNDATAWQAAQDKAWTAYELRAGKKIPKAGLAGTASAPVINSSYEGKAHIANLAATNPTGTKVKGLMNVLRKAVKSNGPNTGSKAKKVKDAMDEFTASYRANNNGADPTTRNEQISPRTKPFPLVDKDELDAGLINDYLNDPAKLNQAALPKFVVVNGRWYLTENAEAFYATRLMGGSYTWMNAEVTHMRFDYALKAKAGIP